MMLQYLQVQEGLAAGRRWLWDEAARKIGILLSAPSAFEGEHFQQVSCLNFSAWVRSMLQLHSSAVPPGLRRLQMWPTSCQPTRHLLHDFRS